MLFDLIIPLLVVANGGIPMLGNTTTRHEFTCSVYLLKNCHLGKKAETK